MSEPKGLLDKHFRLVLWAVAIAAVIYLIGRNIGVFGNVLLVLLGFGAVILVHEFGHFIVAKLSDIKIEAFSIGFPPVLAGILRTQKGWRVRVLPDLFKKKEGDESGEDGLSFYVGKGAEAGETEYRIGLIPFGGFVKMLGQDDIGPVKSSDDPRSFANKPVVSRMGVITAGVVFNVISAVIIFVIVFLAGINLPPAVVGGVLPDSPASRAGLVAGDEIIEIAGKSENLDFGDIMIGAALSDVNAVVPMKVMHEDGAVETVGLVSEQMGGVQMRIFGVLSPQSLTVAKVDDEEKLFKRTGLRAGDVIKAVNGTDVEHYWELEEVVRGALVPKLRILAQRKNELVESQIPLGLGVASGGVKEVKSESDLGHICSMVPRLRIIDASGVPVPIKDKLLSLLNKIGIGKGIADKPRLREGDIIVAAGGIENPTFKEFREVTKRYEKKKLGVKVLRTDPNGVEQTVTVSVVPRRSGSSERVEIGIPLVLDAEHPVVAKTIAVENGPAALAIPRGAVITAVDGADVSSFYDVIGQIRQNIGKSVTIDYRLGENTTGGVTVDLSGGEEFIDVESSFAESVPFENLRRLYKADSPVDAIRLGYKKTVAFIAQTYLTLRRLIGGLVSPKELMGPVGILTLSYRIVAEQPLVYYVYFIGLISACIAVFNFLPLPPLDGGLIVLLAVEKIKGSALSERVQAAIAYAGWVVIGSFALYVTFNDIVRSFFS